MSVSKRRWTVAWAASALAWMLAVMAFYPGSSTQQEVIDVQGSASRSDAGLTEESGTVHKAYLAIMPPVGTLATGLLLSWFVSRPKRGRE